MNLNLMKLTTAVTVAGLLTATPVWAQTQDRESEDRNPKPVIRSYETDVGEDYDGESEVVPTYEDEPAPDGRENLDYTRYREENEANSPALPPSPGWFTPFEYEYEYENGEYKLKRTDDG